MVEQLICNQLVGGSTPFVSSTKQDSSEVGSLLLFYKYVCGYRHRKPRIFRKEKLWPKRKAEPVSPKAEVYPRAFVSIDANLYELTPITLLQQFGSRLLIMKKENITAVCAEKILKSKKEISPAVVSLFYGKAITDIYRFAKTAPKY